MILQVVSKIMIDMNITHNNERKVIDTKVDSYHIRLEGQAEFLTDHVYLHGRIIGLDGKYIGQYNDTSVRLLDKMAIEYRTEASQAIDELINYVSQLNI